MRNFLFFIFLSAFVLESCNAIYIPATPSTPVFKSGSSVKLNSTFGATGLNASLDYSPLTHYYLGGEWHGMKLDSNKHINAGGHVGYYFSPFDENDHLDFQFGYNFGNGHYADVFDSAVSHLYSSSNVYETYHLQAFYVHDVRADKLIGFGVRYDIYRGDYSNVVNHFFKPSIPTKTSFPMAFAFFELPFGRNSPWNLNAFAGVQLSTTNPTQDVPGFYTNFILRVGIAYQLHFGKN